ncbi:hypothetical protein V8F20_001374 [Naviculisporaceae sp. PSN 640]
MPDISQSCGRVRRFFQHLFPRHGVVTGRSEGSTQAQRQPSSMITATDTSTIQIDISDVPEILRPELGLPAHVPVLHIDPADWEVVQRNFVAPLGHPFDPDDPEKPEEAVPLSLRPEFWPGWSLYRVPQHPWSLRGQESTENKKETTPPSYDWAAVSTLPQRTEITNWPAVFAAQREMSRLLEIQSYITARITEIKSQCVETVKKRVKNIPTWQYAYLHTRMCALLSPILGFTEVHGDSDLARLKQLKQEMTKILFVRERLSPVSFLSFLGGSGDGDDPWGWDWDVPRLVELRRRQALAGPIPAMNNYVPLNQVYEHSAIF